MPPQALATVVYVNVVKTKMKLQLPKKDDTTKIDHKTNKFLVRKRLILERGPPPRHAIQHDKTLYKALCEQTDFLVKLFGEDDEKVKYMVAARKEGLRKAKKKAAEKIKEAQRVKKPPIALIRKTALIRVRFGLKVNDHHNMKDRVEQRKLNKDAKAAKFAFDVTHWGLGKDQYGPRMGRAVKFVKRVADPKDPMTYSKARLAMRSQKGKNKKSA